MSTYRDKNYLPKQAVYLPWPTAINMIRCAEIKDDDVWCKFDGDDCCAVDFADNQTLLFVSQYEHDWSEVTPGEGLQPPTCYLVET